MAGTKRERDERATVPPTDGEVAEILRVGEAGVDTAMHVLEATEAAYFGALAATASTPSIVTTNSTW